jgi:hypothetical protein
MHDDNWIDYPSEDLDWDFDSDFYEDYSCDGELDFGITDDNWACGTLEVD